MIEIRDEDLEIISGCDARHPDRRGGQHVAKSCTGVRVLHLPTNIGVTVFDERSQWQNKERALKLLRVLLEHVEHERVVAEQADDQLKSGAW